MKYPEIRIKYAELYVSQVSEHLNELWGDGTPLRTSEEYEDIAKNYREAWQPYEAGILKAMCDALGLSFRQNTIDVYVAPWMRAFSDPMVVGVTYKPDRFVEILTHELTHRLLTDNNESAYGTQYVTEWKKLFGADHEWNVLVHIPVHATLQAVFDDALHEPERTQNDKEICAQWPAYDNAWKYVEKIGHHAVLGQLQESYKNLNES